MLPLLLLTLLSTSSANSDIVEISGNTTNIYRGYRLPANQIPSKYSIYLKVDKEIFSGNSVSFNGKVDVTFTVTENINQVQLHSGVTINNLELKSAEGSIPHVNITSNDTVETSTILFATYLNVSTEYILTINYTGELDTTNMKGFYRSSYVNESGATEYLVTTQLQPSNARKAFPCFDEPHYKAKFDLQITYPRGLNAISNTPQNGTAVLVDEYYETVTFIETPIMSTYLLAFTVSNYTCTTAGEYISDNIPHRVCSRRAIEADRSLAVEYGTKLLQALGEYLGIPYSEMMIGKMDQLAIPDFSANAMENWGMVTYKESALLYNPNETSAYDKQRVISIIAHEFTHMWFGNLVTLDWWDYTFLNEGFARYLQYFIQTKIPELREYEMDRQFVVEVQQSIFLIDALHTSDSLTSKAASPSEITGKFGKISYDKGACIIRMAESLMPETFNQSLQAYLRQNKFSTTLPNDLWNVLSDFVQVENLPSNTNLSTVMDNWTNKAGYPLVTVTASGTDIILTQERFQYSGSDDTQWYTPINYTVFNEDNISTMTVRTWMIPGNNQTIIPNVLSNNSWVIVNPKGSGYYRVHYDNTLWSKIESGIQNRRTVDNVTRSQIIDDVLNLARARKLSYSNAFKKLDFLRNETCYYPWHSAIGGFNYLLLRLGEQSVLGGRVRSMLLELMDAVKIKNKLIGDIDGNNHMYALKVQKILSTTCKLGDEFCVSYSKELFQQYKNGTSIDKGLRSVVYCNALRYSDDIDSDWNFLWNKLQKTSTAAELNNIITSLGCTKNEKLLEYYLEQSVNSSSVIRIQNVADVWGSVYTSSTEGVDVAFNYLSKNYKRIQKYFSKANNLLPGIVDRFSSNEQVQKLEEFMNQQNQNSSIRTDIEKVLRSTRENLEWVSGIESDLNDHFKIVSSASPAVGSEILVPIIISSIFLMKIVI